MPDQNRGERDEYRLPRLIYRLRQLQPSLFWHRLPRRSQITLNSYAFRQGLHLRFWQQYCVVEQRRLQAYAWTNDVPGRKSTASSIIHKRAPANKLKPRVAVPSAVSERVPDSRHRGARQRRLPLRRSRGVTRDDFGTGRRAALAALERRGGMRAGRFEPHAPIFPGPVDDVGQRVERARELDLAGMQRLPACRARARATDNRRSGT